jgi:spermidine synthase
MTGSFKSILIFLFFLSGFCNLVYEIVWTRMFNLVFGVTVFAVSAVLASFMLGMALGGIVFGRVVEKSRNRVALFALIHGGIFLSTMVMVLVFPVFQGFYLFLYSTFHPDFYVFRIIIFFLALALMLIPTSLMGATFPVVAKMLAVQDKRIGKDIGLVYSVNTLGSVIGCVVTVFLLLGLMGMNATVFMAAGIDLCIGLIAFVALKNPLQGQKSA